LGHAERTKMILHIIDGIEEDWDVRYKAIRHEMDSYGGGLLDKPEMVVINKIDSIGEDIFQERMARFKKSFGRRKKPEILAISAAGQLGIKELVSAIEKKFTEIQDFVL
jgi:GTP-binding protein